jgi:hypothetical protein
VQNIKLKQATTGPDCCAIVSFRHPAAAAEALAALRGRSIPELTFHSLKLREWREDKPAAKAASWWRAEPGPPQQQRRAGWAAEDEPRWLPPSGGFAEVPSAEGWDQQGSYAEEEEEEYSDDENDPTVEL